MTKIGELREMEKFFSEPAKIKTQTEGGDHAYRRNEDSRHRKFEQNTRKRIQEPNGKNEKHEERKV